LHPLHEGRKSSQRVKMMRYVFWPTSAAWI
jgi:hypothetical protein